MVSKRNFKTSDDDEIVVIRLFPWEPLINIFSGDHHQ